MASLSDADLCAAVEDAIRPEDDDLLAQLVEQVNAYNAQPPRPLAVGPDAEMVLDVHGFVHWLQGLRDGYFSLPYVIPTDWLRAWVNGYEPGDQWRQPLCPHPSWRCEDCLMGLPNRSPDGQQHYPSSCVVCGSTRLAHSDCSKPAGHFLLPRR